MTEPQGLILETSRRYADREFLVLPDGALSFAGFNARALGLARHLEDRGVGRGDRVLAVLPNSAEYALLFFACFYLGATVVPVNPALHLRDARFIMEKSSAKLKIKELPALNDPLYKRSFRPFQGVLPDDLLTIVFTSGTTAFPKAVAHKVGSFIGNARAFNEAMGNGPEDRFLHLLPMAYSGGFFNLLLAPFLAGSSVVLTPGFGPRTALDFWRLPRARGVNALWLTPTIAAALLTADRDSKGRAWCRAHITKAFIGMAPLHAQAKRDFEAAYGVALWESYGLSETLLAAAQGPKTGAAMVSLPGVKVRAKKGELEIKTPHLMAGYWDYEKKQVAPASGWFASGDLGVVGKDGRVRITGRKKDLIIRAGLNVSPLAVENALLRHEAVAQAAVVGVPSALNGEDIVAVVRLKDGADGSSLEAYCREELSPGQRPAAVLFIDEFPIGSTGKVLKSRLREWAAETLSS